jgi:hypothetical protein
MTVRIDRRVSWLAAAIMLASSLAWVTAQHGGPGQVALDADDIGGIVSSSKGPEAGVWVIAESKDSPTTRLTRR